VGGEADTLKAAKDVAPPSAPVLRSGDGYSAAAKESRARSGGRGEESRCSAASSVGAWRGGVTVLVWNEQRWAYQEELALGVRVSPAGVAVGVFTAGAVAMGRAMELGPPPGEHVSHLPPPQPGTPSQERRGEASVCGGLQDDSWMAEEPAAEEHAAKAMHPAAGGAKVVPQPRWGEQSGQYVLRKCAFDVLGTDGVGYLNEAVKLSSAATRALAAAGGRGRRSTASCARRWTSTAPRRSAMRASLRFRTTRAAGRASAPTESCAAGRRRGDAIVAALPGVEVGAAGRQKDLIDAFANFPLALAAAFLGIYVILAWLFESYLQPLAVMLAIPFGVIGIVWGHLLLGFDMTFLSLIGFVALAGVVVNNSLILVEFSNEMRAKGTPLADALARAGRLRLLPICLTTVTTLAGLAPLMLEQSFQARFLIPMAISLVFGLMSSTVLTLFALPAVMVVIDDLVRLFRRLWYGRDMERGESLVELSAREARA